LVQLEAGRPLTKKKVKMDHPRSPTKRNLRKVQPLFCVHLLATCNLINMSLGITKYSGVLPSSPSTGKKEAQRRRVCTFYVTIYIAIVGLGLLAWGFISKTMNRHSESSTDSRVVEKDFSEVAHPRVIALGCYNFDLLRVGAPRNW
jgi:hypothetical protein